MNVYDFDGTVYGGDSSVDFFLFCVRKKPAVLKKLPLQVSGAVLYAFGRLSKEEYKERFFSFLGEIDDIDAFAEKFWDGHIGKIKKWYLGQKRGDDVFITASPEFLTEPAGKRLGAGGVIASRIDGKTGKFLGKNCKAEEKVRRFREAYPDLSVENFYSDSLSDLPMAKISENSYLVKGERVVKWDIS